MEVSTLVCEVVRQPALLCDAMPSMASALAPSRSDTYLLVWSCDAVGAAAARQVFEIERDSLEGVGL